MTELFRKQRARKAQGKKGFTLIELIIVVAILAVLAGVLIPVVGNALGDSEQKAANSDASAVASALNNMSSFGEIDLAKAVSNGVLTLSDDEFTVLKTRVPGLAQKTAAEAAAAITKVATMTATVNGVTATTVIGLNYSNGEKTGTWGDPYAN